MRSLGQGTLQVSGSSANLLSSCQCWQQPVRTSQRKIEEVQGSRQHHTGSNHTVPARYAAVRLAVCSPKLPVAVMIAVNHSSCQLMCPCYTDERAPEDRRVRRTWVRSLYDRRTRGVCSRMYSPIPTKYMTWAMPKRGAMTRALQPAPFKKAEGPSFLIILLTQSTTPL